MLPSFLKSALPHRLLDPQQRRFYDRPITKTKGEASSVKLLSFLVGGIALANAVLLISAAHRAPASEPSYSEGGPAAAIAAGRTASLVPATDGRAVPDLQEAAPDTPPEPIIATIDRRCAAHAREKLIVGLTHYYLQRRLRPGASSDDAAETSSLTEVLAGPGDPASTTPENSCQG